jgi:23S rRNA pseudouridine1911/1915/1917 synthase
MQKNDGVKHLEIIVDLRTPEEAGVSSLADAYNAPLQRSEDPRSIDAQSKVPRSVDPRLEDAKTRGNAPFVRKHKAKPRLDQYLVEHLPDMTRSHIQKLIADGMILVDGKTAKAGHRLKDGQMLIVSLPPAKPLEIVAEAIPIEILYEDQYLAVVNKPAGMITHPGAGADSGTLVHALMHHMRGSLSGISGTMRPGIVHRLDKDTSGILVIAKQDVAHQSLAKQIQAKIAKRTYLAVLEGKLAIDAGSINAALGRHPSNRTKMAIVKDGRKAISHYQVLNRSANFVLAEVQLETGRTHQIRVHMSSLNCPVVGDLVYNGKTTGTPAYRKRWGLLGHALHAYKLSFFHPVSGKLLEFEAKPPDDLQKLIDRLFK